MAKRQVVLDTETTGLSPQQGHRIIEIGCVEIIDRQITENYYHQYINPEREVDFGAQQVHGLSNDFLEDKPVFADVIADFLNFIRGSELIIHNAPFDVGFIDHEFALHDRTIGKVKSICGIIDTLPMARKKHPGQKNSLDALCKRYSVDNSNRDLHGALLDSRLLAMVYLTMTGGQGSLFDGFDAEQGQKLQNSTDRTRREVKNNLALHIKRASNSELDEHKEYLRKMRKSGECIWE